MKDKSKIHSEIEEVLNFRFHIFKDRHRVLSMIFYITELQPGFSCKRGKKQLPSSELCLYQCGGYSQDHTE